MINPDSTWDQRRIQSFSRDLTRVCFILAITQFGLQIIFIATAVAFQPARIYVICASECYVRPTYPSLFEGGFHITSFMSTIKPPRIPPVICLYLSLSLSLSPFLLLFSPPFCFPRWLVGWFKVAKAKVVTPRPNWGILRMSFPRRRSV